MIFKILEMLLCYIMSSGNLKFQILNHYHEPNFCARPQNSYGEALAPSVSIFGDGTSKEVIRLNTVIRMGP